MQHEEALRLKKRWGNKSCEHPHIEKEYYLGSDTGDTVCTICGKTFPDDDIVKPKFKK